MRARIAYMNYTESLKDINTLKFLCSVYLYIFVEDYGSRITLSKQLYQTFAEQMLHSEQKYQDQG